MARTWIPTTFAASILTVASGTAVAQAIAIAALPFITRLYSPDTYGAFVVFLALGGFVMPVVCARFEVSIALPKRHRSASALAIGSLGVAAAMAAVTAVAIATVSVLSPETGGSGVSFLPLYVLLGGAIQVFSNWSARIGEYRRLSISRIVQAAMVAFLAVGSAHFYGGHSAMLILATIAGQAMGLAVLLGGLPGSDFAYRVRPRQVFRLMKHFRPLATYNVPHVLSDTAQASGLPLLLATMFGAQAAAYYSFSFRLLKAPLGLIGNAVSQVYYPRAAADRNDNAKLRRDALRILTVLTLGALFVLPVLLLVPNAAYAFAFGPAWQDVGSYLRVLTPWILASFVAAPLSILYLVKEEWALDFYLGLAGSILAFAILGVARFVSDGVLFTIGALSAGMTIYVAATTIIEFKIVIGRGDRRV